MKRFIYVYFLSFRDITIYYSKICVCFAVLPKSRLRWHRVRNLV